MSKVVMKRYDAYKKTDSCWFDEAPFHWISGRLKNFVNANAVTKVPANLTDDDLVEFIPMTNVNDEIGKIKQFNFAPLKEVSSGYTKFRNGDVIFAKITPCMENGNCAIVHGLTYGISFGSTEFMVFRPLRKLTEKYLHYFLHNEFFRKNAEAFMKGTAGQKRISSHYMATHYFALPPLHEQKIIANYLDTKTAHIDRKIDLLSQKATQYGKLKQSLINETVTRGLDKTVSMKDSGVDWLGDVPEHWKVNRLKNLAYIKTGGKDTIDNVEEGAYPFFVRSQTIERINSYSFDGEAILTAGDGVGVGKVFHHVNCKFDYHQRVYKISNFRRVVGKFVFYYMRENFHKDALRLNAKSTVDSLRMPMFQNFTIAFGDIEEQQAIVDYLDTKTVHIDRIVETINTQIEKLKELRKTLINDVVTGKIKVV
jgi:type I restriction enzyme S subunit